MKAVIGITPQVDTGRNRLYLDEGYMREVRLAGGVPIMLPLTDSAEDIRAAAGMCDGFIFTGGHDIAPEMYGEERIPQCGHCVPMLDAMEEMLLKRVMKDGRPVLGICRGMQLINAVLSGTLYQDIPAQLERYENHSQERPYELAAHGVELVPGSPLQSLLGKDKLEVNSIHHQSVKELSPWLKLMASAPDGLAEAAYMPGHRFLWAIQWHPELMPENDPDSRKIFGAFVKACTD